MPQDIGRSFSHSFGLGRRPDPRPLGDYPTRSAEVLGSWQNQWDQLGVPQGDPLREITRWLDTKPPFATWFNHAEQAILLVGATRLELTAFTIPAGHFGVLRFFANSVANSSDAQYVTFAILLDGAALPGWAAITMPVCPSLQAPTPMMDPLKGGQRLSVVASSSSPAPVQGAAALIRGWMWAAQLQPSTWQPGQS